MRNLFFSVLTALLLMPILLSAESTQPTVIDSFIIDGSAPGFSQGINFIKLEYCLMKFHPDSVKLLFTGLTDMKPYINPYEAPGGHRDTLTGYRRANYGVNFATANGYDSEVVGIEVKTQYRGVKILVVKKQPVKIEELIVKAVKVKRDTLVIKVKELFQPKTVSRIQYRLGGVVSSDELAGASVQANLRNGTMLRVDYLHHTQDDYARSRFLVGRNLGKTKFLNMLYLFSGLTIEQQFDEDWNSKGFALSLAYSYEILDNLYISPNVNFDYLYQHKQAILSQLKLDGGRLYQNIDRMETKKWVSNAYFEIQINFNLN